MELNKEKLNKYKEKYNSCKTNLILENALSNNELKKIIKNPRVIQSTGNLFEHNIKTLPAPNQERSGRCWMFAGLNIIRESIAKKYNLEEFELSQDYLSFYDKLEKCNYFMNSVISLGDVPFDDRTLMWFLKEGYTEGGQWNMFANLVNKYGVMPKNAVTETFQALNSNQMIDIIYNNLRKFSFDIQGKSNKEKENIKEEYLEKFYNLLKMCYGTFNDTFTFEIMDKDNKYTKIENLTPLKFYKECTDIDVNDYVVLLSCESINKKANKLYQVKYSNNVSGTEDATYLNIEMKKLKEIVKKQINDDLPVWFTCDCLPFMDRDKATWDIDGYNYQDAFNMDIKFDKKTMLDYYISAPNHAMVITGYNNKPARWKIENSWGQDKGVKGYYIGTDDWFNLYVYQVAVNKKYVDKELLKLLEEKPVILNPWDPLGAVTK